jgi:hypothetical protein
VLNVPAECLLGYTYYLYFRRDEPRVSSSESMVSKSLPPLVSIILSPSPPQSADFILCIFVPGKDQEGAILATMP